jgi:hypothetical protein
LVCVACRSILTFLKRHVRFLSSLKKTINLTQETYKPCQMFFIIFRVTFALALVNNLEKHGISMIPRLHASLVQRGNCLDASC